MSTLRTVALFIASYAFAGVALRQGRDPVWSLIQELFTMPDELARVVWMIGKLLSASYQGALYTATLVAPLGFLARTVARARVRASLPDPLNRARRFFQTRLGSAAIAAPSFGWAGLLYLYYRAITTHWPAVARTWDEQCVSFGIPALMAFVAHTALVQRFVRSLVAPTLRPDEVGVHGQEKDAEGFTFDAVAVTPETRGVVAALGLLSIAMTAAAASLPLRTLMRDSRFFAALILYMAVAAVGVVAFQRVSRVSIGVDGILIGGSTRTRFFAYREVDGARARGGDLELLRGDRVILRLQLHGKDAPRREALLARIRAAIAHADVARRDPALAFVESASTEDLTVAAAGAASTYRRVAPSREKLWELLEGPAIGAEARRAAATALARTANAAEAERLRVAVERWAHPAARSEIQELVEDVEETGQPPARRLARRD